MKNDEEEEGEIESIEKPARSFFSEVEKPIIAFLKNQMESGGPVRGYGVSTLKNLNKKAKGRKLQNIV